MRYMCTLTKQVGTYTLKSKCESKSSSLSSISLNQSVKAACTTDETDTTITNHTNVPRHPNFYHKVDFLNSIFYLYLSFKPLESMNLKLFLRCLFQTIERGRFLSHMKELLQIILHVPAIPTNVLRLQITDIDVFTLVYCESRGTRFNV